MCVFRCNKWITLPEIAPIKIFFFLAILALQLALHYLKFIFSGMLRNSSCHKWGETSLCFSNTREWEESYRWRRKADGHYQVVMKPHRGASIFLTYFSSSVSGNRHFSDTNVMLFWADSSQLNLHLSFGMMSGMDL